MLNKLKANRALYLSIGVLVLILLYQIDRSFFVDRGAKHLDFKWIYVAGKCWLHGLSPYNTEQFYAMWESVLAVPANGRPFAYPPTMAFIAVPSALFDWETGAKLFNILNIGVFFACLLFIGLLINLNSHYKYDSARFWIGLILAASVSINSVAIYLGQTPFFSFLGCLGVLYFSQLNRVWPAVLFFLLASTKPQLALTPLFLVLLDKPRFFSIGFLCTLFVSLLILGLFYEANGLQHIHHSLSINLNLEENSFSHLLVVYRLLEGIGLEANRFAIELLGPLILLLIWLGMRWRQIPTIRLNKLMLIALAFSLTSVFAPLHEYDLTILSFSMALIPILPSAWTLLFLPSILLIARPGGLLFLLHEWGITLPWTKTEFPLYFGSVYLFLIILAYFAIELFTKPWSQNEG